MTLANELAGEIQRRAKDMLTKDMAVAIQIVLAAPSETLTAMYAKIEALLNCKVKE